jgi:hypothetical protein
MLGCSGEVERISPGDGSSYMSAVKIDIGQASVDVAMTCQHRSAKWREKSTNDPYETLLCWTPFELTHTHTHTHTDKKKIFSSENTHSTFQLRLQIVRHDGKIGMSTWFYALTTFVRIQDQCECSGLKNYPCPCHETNSEHSVHD